MTADFIIDVDENNFEYEVLSYSQNVPVVVDFWATWCQPCKILSPLLEGLAHEAMGSFRLAKVEVDSNPNLAFQFSIRTVPTIKAFSGGQIVADFVGNQPEERVRLFLSKLTPPSRSSLAFEKGFSMIANHDWEEALNLFQTLSEQFPDQAEVLLGLAKANLGLGNPFEPLLILRNFPTSKLYPNAERLIPYAEALARLKKDQLPGENDLDLIFNNSIRLASKGNLPAAMDGLLDLLKQNKKYRNGLAQSVIIALFELYGENQNLVREYRSELASILF